MELSTDQHVHPIMQLRDDILNFMEAIDAQPGSEINKTGFKFARLLKELYETYQMEYAIEHMESCFHSPDYINHKDPDLKKESGQRKKGNYISE